MPKVHIDRDINYPEENYCNFFMYYTAPFLWLWDPLGLRMPFDEPGMMVAILHRKMFGQLQDDASPQILTSTTELLTEYGCSSASTTNHSVSLFNDVFFHRRVST